ncbi:SCP2 sterol-binding domain-containing protein [Tropicibacter sp. Alg240-R139]|uniref:SCP2 sterol-binding domain-containing protein n=1 Tax=Tropicibacter sp. Alg240-R139 TaxID=2305991 RepID=UPI000EFA3AAD|nr:SCP2 sterol-binding domain-containing protein [Tropicibacter sp. Alg240-R139]
MSDMIAKAVEELDTKAKASGMSETVKFNIEGEGAVVIDGTGARASDEEADLTVTADAETFQGILDGSIDSTSAFMMGKITIDGDMGLAMKLGTILG